MKELFESLKQRSDWILIEEPVNACAEVMEDACTPRPPQPEWFGTGPGQWDSWWFGECGVLHRCKARDEQGDLVIDGIDEVGERSTVYIKCATMPHAIDECLPVFRDGYPAPVGWHVVERGNAVLASVPQPPPLPGSIKVAPRVMESLANMGETALRDLVQARATFGRAKYGTDLETLNGRDAYEDARQELGDLLMYAGQMALEGRSKELASLARDVNDAALFLMEVAHGRGDI